MKVNATRKKSGRTRVLVALVTTAALLSASWRVFCGLTCPILIYNEAPECRVSVNGSQLRFESGVATVYPFFDSYNVAVACPSWQEQRKVYPLRPESDSGIIVVKGDRAEFTLENTVIAPH